MKSALNRIKALEADLTPQQVILRLLARKAEFDNPDSFIAWAYTPEALAWMAEMRENMYESVKKRVANKDRREISQACRKASREVRFLYSLAMDPGMQLDADQYRYLYFTSEMVHWLSGVWRRYTESGKDLAVVREALLRFKGFAESLLPELLRDRQVEERIRRRYFNEGSLFFKTQRVVVGLSDFPCGSTNRAFQRGCGDVARYESRSKSLAASENRCSGPSGTG